MYKKELDNTDKNIIYCKIFLSVSLISILPFCSTDMYGHKISFITMCMHNNGRCTLNALRLKQILPDNRNVKINLSVKMGYISRAIKQRFYSYNKEYLFSQQRSMKTCI